MKKKLLATLLTIATLLTALPLTAFAAENGSPPSDTSADLPHPAVSSDQLAAVEPIEVDTFEKIALSADSVPMGLELASLQSAGYTSRVYAAEPDLNSVVLADKYGNCTLFYYENPVKYVDELGFVNDKVLTLVSQSDGSYRTAASDILTTFAPSISGGIELSTFDKTLRLTPDSADAVAVLSADSKKVTYEVDPQTSYVYSLTSMGFKEDIVVESYTGQTEYSFILDTYGMALVQNDEQFVLVDERGDVQGYLSEIVLFTADERNNAFGAMRAEAIVEGEQYCLTVELDEGWLADPKTVYPITIDPSITLNTTGNIEDVSIVSTTTHSGTSGSLYIGRGSSGAALRTLMRFPNLSIKGYTVSKATISIRDLMCEDVAQVVECREYTGNSWSESGTTTWSSVGSSAVGSLLSQLTIQFGKGNSSSDSQRYEFDITALAKKWASGSAYPTKGLLFKATDSYESTGAKTYRSFASINRGSYLPVLTVVYSENVTSTISVSPTSASLYVGQTVQLSATPNPSATVSWSTSSSSIATVNSSGLVTAKGTGTATITATANGVSAKCTVTVKQGAITVTYPTDNAIVGKTIQLTATTTPSGRSVSWSSSNTQVATVNSNGLFTFNLAGEVTITASSNGLGSQSVKLYGIVENGIYNLQSAGSHLYAQMSGTNIFQAKNDIIQDGIYSPASNVSLMWRIHYIGNGRYTIRSYNNSARAMATISGVACLSDHVPANDSYNENYGVTQWYITQTEKYYYILTNVSSGKVIGLPAGDSKEGTLLTLFDSAGTMSNSNRRWIFVKISDDKVPKGLYLYKKRLSSSIWDLYTDTSLTLEVGDTRSIRAIYRHPDNVSQSFTYDTSDKSTDIITINQSGDVSALTYGTKTVIIVHKNSGKSIDYVVNVKYELNYMLNLMSDVYEVVLSYHQNKDIDATLNDTFSFIRHWKYNSSNWDNVAGKISDDLLSYIEDNKPKTFNFFASNASRSDILIVSDTKSIYSIDLVHMSATMSRLFYRGKTTYYGFNVNSIARKYFDDLSGWAGDFQTLIVDYYKQGYNLKTREDIYSHFYDMLGKDQYSFSMSDLLADIDACNIYELLNAKKPQNRNEFYNVIYQYYYSSESNNRGAESRFTTWANTDDVKLIGIRAETYARADYLSPLLNAWPLLEGYTPTYDEELAFSYAFRDFIWTFVSREQ